MKISLTKIEANPFRKELGEYDKTQIERIIESFKMSDFGKDQRFEVRHFKKRFQLIYGHHRVEALRKFYGQNITVEIVVRNYDDKKMLVELLRENLSREQNWDLQMRSLILAKNYLRKNLRKKNVELSDIMNFISVDGKILKKDSILILLRIAENLAPDLIKKIVKQVGPSETENGAIGFSQAIMLSTFKDYQEQRDLVLALRNSIIQVKDEQNKLLRKYRYLPNDLKEKIRKGKLDLVIAENSQESNLEKENRVTEYNKFLKGKQIVTGNQQVIYIYTCLSDAIANIKKLKPKQLNRNAKNGLCGIYQKTMNILSKEMQKLKGEENEDENIKY